MKQYLELGKIVSTHGIKGEVRINPMCSTPEFATGFKTLFLDEKGEKSIKVLSARAHKNIVIMRLEGINSIEQAEHCNGAVLYIDKDDAELADDEYFIEDLIGCSVFDIETDEKLGEISDVTSLPSNDVWHIMTKSGEVLIPKIPDVIKEVDLDKESVKIFKMKGLFDDED